MLCTVSRRLNCWRLQMRSGKPHGVPEVALGAARARPAYGVRTDLKIRIAPRLMCGPPWIMLLRTPPRPHIDKGPRVPFVELKFDDDYPEPMITNPTA
jgi:hypothetical protein